MTERDELRRMEQLTAEIKLKAEQHSQQLMLEAYRDTIGTIRSLVLICASDPEQFLQRVSSLIDMVEIGELIYWGDDASTDSD